MKRYRVLYDTSVFKATGQIRDFTAGEIVTGTEKTIDSLNVIDVSGFNIPADYVESVGLSPWLWAGGGILVLVMIIVVLRLIKK